MKKIITTVGTSLITNYNKDSKSDISREIKDEPYSEYDELKDEIDEIKKKLLEYLNKKSDNACAEITSMNKVKEKYPNEEFEIYLIATDTLESVVVAEVLEEFFKNQSQQVTFKKDNIIEYLNVLNNSLDLVKKGYKNLIKKLLNITSGYNEIYNISGGYKALIPLVSHIASYKKINLIYIYENSDFLIEIPPFPFDIEKELINYLTNIFNKIDQESAIKKVDFEKMIKNIPFEKQRKIEYLFEEEDDELIITSMIGDILLEDYLAFKDIEIVECKEKDFKVNGGRHHDKEIVEKFGKKLIQNPYVCKILGSAEYETKKRDFILEIEPQFQTGVIKIKIPNEEKATILIKTSGRNFKETEKIAQILEKQYKG